MDRCGFLGRPLVTAERLNAGFVDAPASPFSSWHRRRHGSPSAAIRLEPAIWAPPHGVHPEHFGPASLAEDLVRVAPELRLRGGLAGRRRRRSGGHGGDYTPA